MPLSLNPRVKAKLDALPKGPEKELLKDLMNYEIEHNSGDRSEKRYKDEIMRIVDKHVLKSNARDEE